MSAVAPPLAVFDSGLRDGREHHALDRLALRACAAGGFGATLRFHRSRPTASLGRFQAADRELRLGVCAERGIAVVRRPSGGGALYLDPDQLGFSLTAAPGALPPAPLAVQLERAARALAAALARLGVDAGFKAPNDVEVDGRKLASVFAACEDGAWQITGTLLLDADVKAMQEALKVPTEKLSADGLAAARDRLVTLTERLGGVPSPATLQTLVAEALAAAFGFAPASVARAALVPRALLPLEDCAALAPDWSAPRGGALEVLTKARGVTLRLRARFDGAAYRDVEFATDVHAVPGDLLQRLGAALEGVPAPEAASRLEAAFAAAGGDAVAIGPEDLAEALAQVADKRRLQESAGLTQAEADAVMLHGPGGAGAQATLAQATAMLVPYCAKPAWCKWRHRDGCPECGRCEVSEAYRLARERGMQVITVTRYEHLVETLERLRREGRAYVGMCCSHFFLKRHAAFARAELPAVLMDVSGSNCYELHQEADAYAGRFQAQARLQLPVLEKLMRFVPPGRDAAAAEREDEP
ncbi:MAG: lipoyl protein ligase domain-containing protein [Pseudomonadota bacterium]